jgi:hypothetical protein
MVAALRPVSSRTFDLGMGFIADVMDAPLSWTNSRPVALLHDSSCQRFIVVSPPKNPVSSTARFIACHRRFVPVGINRVWVRVRSSSCSVLRCLRRVLSGKLHAASSLFVFIINILSVCRMICRSVCQLLRRQVFRALDNFYVREIIGQ